MNRVIKILLNARLAKYEFDNHKYSENDIHVLRGSVNNELRGLIDAAGGMAGAW